MALAKRKKMAEAFKDAFEVVNMNAGHVVSFHDHGVDINGNPVNGRVSSIAKFGMVDETDGDPLFVVGEFENGAYVFKGWPKHIIDNDQRANVKLSALARTVNDASRNPLYKTLGEKALARKHAHEAEEARLRMEREEGRQPKIVLPPEIASVYKVLADKALADAEKKATKTAPMLARGPA